MVYTQTATWLPYWYRALRVYTVTVDKNGLFIGADDADTDDDGAALFRIILHILMITMNVFRASFAKYLISTSHFLLLSKISTTQDYNCT